MTGLPSVTATMIQPMLAGQNATQVITSAAKVALPCPPITDGVPFVFPDGYEKAGGPVPAYGKKPTDVGVFWRNLAAEQAWQGVSNDGTGVFIFNEMTELEAASLIAGYRARLTPGVPASLRTVLRFIAFAQEAAKRVHLGEDNPASDTADMYDTNADFVRDNLSPVQIGVNTFEHNGVTFGWVKRDKRDICAAVFIAGGFTLQNPEGGQQEFADGGVIVMQGGRIRGVATGEFERTYRLASGGAMIESAAAALYNVSLQDLGGDQA